MTMTLWSDDKTRRTLRIPIRTEDILSTQSESSEGAAQEPLPSAGTAELSVYTLLTSQGNTMTL